MQRNLGGDRLGSGNKMTVKYEAYERSTHDLGYIFMSSQAPGTVIPFFYEIGLPGDTWDIEIDGKELTHPTIGPLYGSYKMQYDAFIAPMSLYIGRLHNNPKNIGLKMDEVLYPTMTLYAAPISADAAETDIDNAQVNPSCLLNYLGIRGIGNVDAGDTIKPRNFQALGLLMYWEVIANYYANQQEEIGAGIHTPKEPLFGSPEIEWNHAGDPSNPLPKIGTDTPIAEVMFPGDAITITSGSDIVKLYQIRIKINDQWYGAEDGTWWNIIGVGGNVFELQFKPTGTYPLLQGWDYITSNTIPNQAPQVVTFPLENIDKMRMAILEHGSNTSAFEINSVNLAPYNWLAPLAPPTGPEDLTYLSTQESLAVKTYQSDIFNNYLNSEWISGPSGVNQLTKVSTAGNEFSIDSLIIANKIYDIYNRIAVSGGSYHDWVEVTWDVEVRRRVESPMYMGGLSKEIIFQEVVSNAETTDQPLGTIAGKGTLADKHKGGKIYIKVEEPSILMMMVSITPRLVYSQGNRWHVGLESMDDLHKPGLDQIGFQDLVQEKQAWWTTSWDVVNNKWVQKATGKQPAWLDYQTNYNRSYGNFAIKTNEMWMTLNRRYEEANNEIVDNTTYIDPVKYNNIFAQTSIDAQNFWTQIKIEATVRRKMSAKVMPNL